VSDVLLPVLDKLRAGASSPSLRELADYVSAHSDFQVVDETNE